MKKFLFFFPILFLIIFSILFIPVNATAEISVYLNGEKLSFDVPPTNINGRILVPFRNILEALGAEVTYEKSKDGDYPNGIAKGDTLGKSLIIPIGEKFVSINSCTVELDVPAQIINGSTLVPLRVVSQCMGADVEWNSSTQSVMITCSRETSKYWNDSCSYYGNNTFSEHTYLANGYGTIYNNEENQIICRGYFENDYIIEGTYHYSNGNIYVGEFSNTHFAYRHGKGYILYDDGSTLDCYWDNDVPNGNFHFYLSATNTHVYGKAINGVWDGEITLSNPNNGTTYTALYKNGKLVSEDTSNVPVNPYYENPSVIYSFTTAKYPLYLYSNDQKTFLGKLVTDKYDDDSFSYSYGNYGSKYSRTSIFNKYGNYGSKYSNESAFNKYASKPPIIVDSNGQFVAYLTENTYEIKGITYLELLSILRKHYQ